MATVLTGFNFSLVMQSAISETRDNKIISGTAGVSFAPATDLGSGTGADQVDLTIEDRGRALTGGATEDIDMFDWAQTDLGAGAGRDLLGNTVSFVEVAGLAVVNQSTSIGGCRIGGKGTPAAWNSLFDGSDTAKLKSLTPGGVFWIYDPGDPALAVADTSNHLLQIEAVGGNITYDIYVFGRTA